jgi:hypothetical protein
MKEAPVERLVATQAKVLRLFSRALGDLEQADIVPAAVTVS